MMGFNYYNDNPYMYRPAFYNQAIYNNNNSNNIHQNVHPHLHNHVYSHGHNHAQAVYTGYYGMTHQPNLGFHQNLNKGMAKKSKKGGTPATMQHQQHQPENASPGKSGLYPKIRRKRAAPKSYYNKEELLVQYQNQKKAEVIFFNLQAQKAYVEEMIANDPRLHQYYSLWLSKANEALKDYSRVIDQPDNLSFSSVYGYSKDEEIRAVYRHPILEKQLRNM